MTTPNDHDRSNHSNRQTETSYGHSMLCPNPSNHPNCDRQTEAPYGQMAICPNHTDRPNRPNPFPQPEDPNNDTLQIIAIGPRAIVDHFMIRQHQLGYAEPKEWSRALPAPDGINIMRILTKRFPKRRNG